jgi:surface protein
VDDARSNVGSVITMENMFRSASAFNQDLSVWNVGSVTTMENIFSQCLGL